MNTLDGPLTHFERPKIQLASLLIRDGVGNNLLECVNEYVLRVRVALNIA